jgi:hypothetical protein
MFIWWKSYLTSSNTLFMVGAVLYTNEANIYM